MGPGLNTQLNPHHKLAFGESFAQECNSVLAFAEVTREAVPGLIDYDASEPQFFRSRSAFSQVNGLGLYVASMPNAQTFAKVGGNETRTFAFHLKGECHFHAEGKIWSVLPETQAVFLPKSCPWVVEVLNPSTVVASIQSNKLESVAQTMLGPDSGETLKHKFRNPASPKLEFGPVHFHQIFRNLFAQVDAYSRNQALLDSSGLDDVLYRNLAVALAPQEFATQAQKPLVKATPRQVDRICQFVIAQISTRITLTELEQFGHMSRRTLHNAFMKSFGLSPMAWVREQRLLKARSMLQKSYETTSVTQTLYSCGFTNASLFSAQYQHRFGELPSETFRRSRSHR